MYIQHAIHTWTRNEAVKSHLNRYTFTMRKWTAKILGASWLTWNWVIVIFLLPALSAASLTNIYYSHEYIFFHFPCLGKFISFYCLCEDLWDRRMYMMHEYFQPNKQFATGKLRFFEIEVFFCATISCIHHNNKK